MKILPIAADAWRFVIPLFGGAFLFLSLRRDWAVPIAVLLIVLGCFCLYFFRDFEVPVKIDDRQILSPGCGCIMEAGPIKNEAGDSRQIVRIFLSVFDVHVQRTPVSGTVQKIVHKPGLFLDARNPEAHVRNEQNSVLISNSHGVVEVTQIAGLIARRIVCWIKEGESLNQGDRYGLIRFGSQVDLILPNNVQLQVKEGDRVVSGVTVIGQWK